MSFDALIIRFNCENLLVKNWQITRIKWFPRPLIVIFERPAVGKRSFIIFGMVKFLNRIFNSSETVFNLINTVDFLIRRM